MTSITTTNTAIGLGSLTQIVVFGAIIFAMQVNKNYSILINSIIIDVVDK